MARHLWKIGGLGVISSLSNQTWTSISPYFLYFWRFQGKITIVYISTCWYCKKNNHESAECYFVKMKSNLPYLVYLLTSCIYDVFKTNLQYPLILLIFQSIWSLGWCDFDTIFCEKIGGRGLFCSISSYLLNFCCFQDRLSPHFIDFSKNMVMRVLWFWQKYEVQLFFCHFQIKLTLVYLLIFCIL